MVAPDDTELKPRIDHRYDCVGGILPMSTALPERGGSSGKSGSMVRTGASSTLELPGLQSGFMALWLGDWSYDNHGFVHAGILWLIWP